MSLQSILGLCPLLFCPAILIYSHILWKKKGFPFTSFPLSSSINFGLKFQCYFEIFYYFCKAHFNFDKICLATSAFVQIFLYFVKYLLNFQLVSNAFDSESFGWKFCNHTLKNCFRDLLAEI